MAGKLQRPPTRAELNRELMLRAATSWDGLAALALVAGAGVVLGVALLIPVAVILWLAASVWHYFDGSEADKLAAERAARRSQAQEASRLDPASLCDTVARTLLRARSQEESIRHTIVDSELPSDLTADVDALVQAFEATALRADRIYRTIERQRSNGQDAAALERRLAELRARESGAASEDEKALMEALTAQLAATRRAEDLRDRFFTTMERMVAELGTIDAEILGMSATDAAAGQRQVAGQLSDLRELVAGLSSDMQQSERARAELPAV